MPLEFHNNSIVLSGSTGTKLKTGILTKYYKFWSEVTAGGRSRGFRFNNFIGDMNSGTGKVYIEDEDIEILGSAGHALELRYGSSGNTLPNIAIHLVERDDECRKRLLQVVKKEWPEVNFSRDNEGYYISEDGMSHLYSSASKFLKYSERGQVAGIGLFFFDPLLATDWGVVEQIAEARIQEPYQTGTEFLVFFFTSDWVKGRTNFAPLPRTRDENEWGKEQKESVEKADEAFGDRSWLDVMASRANDEELQEQLVTLYKEKLRKWFRFVLPLPFVPKENQLYHVFCCSNYYLGMRVVASFYGERTTDFGLQSDNSITTERFKQEHPNLFSGLKGRAKPVEWRILWQIMRNHIGGICDEECRTINEIAEDKDSNVTDVLDWLLAEGYLKEVEPPGWPWDGDQFSIYEIDWETTDRRLGVNEPVPPTPLKPDE
ncbi:MAG: three-Cys-motif partner protein TcmP [Candidatus Lokiarchaeota archaeon]|nr:three-Cys-motif partner protein TcmP [Candidatus Lokiarchaeota archaeon]